MTKNIAYNLSVMIAFVFPFVTNSINSIIIIIINIIINSVNSTNSTNRALTTSIVEAKLIRSLKMGRGLGWGRGRAICYVNIHRIALIQVLVFVCVFTVRIMAIFDVSDSVYCCIRRNLWTSFCTFRHISSHFGKNLVRN